MIASRRRVIARSTVEAVQAGRDARHALARANDRIRARRCEDVSTNGDGLLIPDLRRMTNQEQIDALGIALSWIQRGEEHTRRMRVLVERQLERLLREEL